MKDLDKPLDGPPVKTVEVTMPDGRRVSRQAEVEEAKPPHRVDRSVYMPRLVPEPIPGHVLVETTEGWLAVKDTTNG